ncbi:phage tail tip lysozyme [Burkholderia cepacia]|uniref:phage tail tip lysozyme n=1 Tax=Burkholderia cepacia TaxID=292 RepID=UPI00158AC7FD|nr:phage tail tip lysozyme [Burkholderia cepacia]
MAEEFVLRIRTEEDATAAAKKIEAAFAKITAPIDRVQKRFASAGAVGTRSFEKLTKGIEQAARAAHTLVDKVVELVPGLAAIGAAGTIAGLVGLTNRFGNFGFALNKSSKLLGMNAQDLAAWHVAAKRAGVSADEFDSAMSSSQMSIRAAAFGADPHAMVLLQKMGVQIQRNKDGSIDYYTTQMRLMRAIQGQRSVEAQRDAAGTFGMGGLLPMLQQGTYDEDKARALRKGLIPTPDEIARAGQFKRDVNDLEDSVAGLGNSIGSHLLPILDPVVNSFAAWLDKNRASIADKLSAAVQKFVTWLSKIDWDDVSKKAKTLWDGIGGVKGVMIAIAGLTLAGPIASVASLISGLMTLTTVTVPAAAGALAGLASAPVLAAILALLHSKNLNEGEDGEVAKHQAKPGEEWDGDPIGKQHRAVAEAATKDPKTAVAMASLQAMGWTKAQAAGMVANLWIESNLNPNVVGDNGHAYGIGQWHEDRQADFKAWAGHDIRGSTLDEQLRFMNYELREGKFWAAGQRLHATKASQDSGRVVSKYYERPKNVEQEMDKRGSLADAIAGVTPPELTAPAATGAPGSGSQSDVHDARVRGMQQESMRITLDMKNVPQGMRAEAKTADGSYLPTRVEYRLDGM